MKAIIFLLATSLVFTSCDETNSAKVASVTSSQPEVITTAVQYNKSYQANEVNADNKYKGKQIKITGTLESINKDFTEDVYLVLTTGEMELGVHCTLADPAGAADLVKGQKITLQGEGAGMTIGIPSVNDCKIVQ
jgi:hypothetical protein